MDILKKIVEFKIKNIAKKKLAAPTSSLEKSEYLNRKTYSLSEHLKTHPVGIIAEFKRKSPSRPNINLDAQIEDVSLGYAQAGASAMSILTDQKFFGGSSKDLNIARNKIELPILRKDFIIDEYQILEARAIGADAILLIAEILSAEQVANLSQFAKSLGLEVLLEMHAEDQLEKIADTVDILGVNNRDLKTFETNIAFSIELFPQLPNSFVKISESGLHTPEDVVQLIDTGFDGFLIGERFMKKPKPAEACKEFLSQVQSKISAHAR